MKKCEYCGKEIKDRYLQVDSDFFDKQMISFDNVAYCCKECLICELAECGVIEDKEL